MSAPASIERATRDDVADVAKLACLLWPECAFDELAEEFDELVDDGDAAIFVSRGENGEAAGFAQCQLRRDYVEGTSTSPVGYLEGIFIRPEYRRSDRARDLTAACESWARAKGCTEFASDCELENEASIAFHRNIGFREANRLVCFAKTL